MPCRSFETGRGIQRRRFLAVLLSTALALALFYPARHCAAGEPIKLTEKHIQGFMTRLREHGEAIRERGIRTDPKVEAQAAAVAKRTALPASTI